MALAHPHAPTSSRLGGKMAEIATPMQNSHETGEIRRAAG
jgi:hypothetical protein